MARVETLSFKRTFTQALLIVLALCSAMPATALAFGIGEEDMEGVEGSVGLILFWREGCPHCKKELGFLEELKGRYPNLNVKIGTR